MNGKERILIVKAIGEKNIDNRISQNLKKILGRIWQFDILGFFSHDDLSAPLFFFGRIGVLLGFWGLHHPSFWRCLDFSLFFFFWGGGGGGRVRHKLLHLRDVPILLCLRDYLDGIGSLDGNLLMIAEIKYLLGFDGRLITVHLHLDGDLNFSLEGSVTNFFIL